jgi:hypothetical protein
MVMNGYPDIVKYRGKGVNKYYDVNEALRLGKWSPNVFYGPFVLRDRLTGELVEAKYVGIELDTYIVYYKKGGWQCLDFAINQFEYVK